MDIRDMIRYHVCQCFARKSRYYTLIEGEGKFIYLAIWCWRI